MTSLTEHCLHLTRPHPLDQNGEQRIYKFANGYGASVVRFFGSYGVEHHKLELAVLVFEGDSWKLTYETPITNDVIGHLSPDEVNATLTQIEALEAA